ncbi:MAG: segregation/condensation protein A [Rickettsiales bacterium]|nr:segregation/condensation protein A [Rickettsiales bacterium]|tara:strand:- start:415 stop:1263 length:849 start_codon:yes stop_codon:yes gene_type:complete
MEQIKTTDFEEDAVPPYKNGTDGSDIEMQKFVLNLKLENYEGPLDLLLELARDQKVDLLQISIVPLVDQYIQFIEEAKSLEIVVAAEYLVMAAWLTYLKSKLLLPQDDEEGEEPTGQMLAEALTYQLKRLEAMRTAAEEIFKRPMLKQDFWPRGNPEGLAITTISRYDMTLLDLMQAYGDIDRRKNYSSYKPEAYKLLSLDEALERLEQMIGKIVKKEWMTLKSFMFGNEEVSKEERKNKLFIRSHLASTLVASLEMAKRGDIDLRQDKAFEDIYLKKKESA